MNSKKVKAIRQLMNAELKQYGMTVRTRAYEQRIVPSNRKRYRITVKEGYTTQEYTNSAIQIRLQAGVPRQVYQQVKRHVAMSTSQTSFTEGNERVQAGRTA